MLRLFLSLQFRKIVFLAIVKATRTGCTYFSGSSTDKKKKSSSRHTDGGDWIGCCDQWLSISLIYVCHGW